MCCKRKQKIQKRDKKIDINIFRIRIESPPYRNFPMGCKRIKYSVYITISNAIIIIKHEILHRRVNIIYANVYCFTMIYYILLGEDKGCNIPVISIIIIHTHICIYVIFDFGSTGDGSVCDLHYFSVPSDYAKANPGQSAQLAN